jgi:hypothetical protein
VDPDCQQADIVAVDGRNDRREPLGGLHVVVDRVGDAEPGREPGQNVAAHAAGAGRLVSQLDTRHLSSMASLPDAQHASIHRPPPTLRLEAEHRCPPR